MENNILSGVFGGTTMITGVIKNKIDKIWTDIWAGGITNPLTVIEQLTYLMFMRSLDEKELEAITVRKGTLTDSERKQVQSHVVYTRRMLDKMHFKGIYREVPFWSGSHHEFLNGRGYPNGLTADDLPDQSRLLTIIDVYDALTAEDRPYKPPMPPEKAFGILKSMRDDGQIDGRLLDEFIESEAWKKDK